MVAMVIVATATAALIVTYLAVYVIKPKSFELEACLTRWISLKLKIQRDDPPSPTSE